ncbi:MAG: Calx-beta domain-containing protein, partial [Candidatus Poribacteria bacterium]
DTGTASAGVTVSLSEASAQDITVGYSTVEGSAADGSDYTAASGSVVLAAGALDAIIVVDVLGDLTNEADETLTVTLASVAGDGAVVADASAVLTILDNDDVSVSIADVAATEGANASFVLTLSGVSEQTVAVTAAVLAGSATDGVDFTAPEPTTVEFAPGETSATFSVGVLDDAIHEADETFTVILTTPTGRGVSIADDAAVATIQDTDALTVSVADASVAEGDTTDTVLTFAVSLSLSGVSEQTITADFAIAGAQDDGATSGVDYEAPALATVSFPAGETSVDVSVTVLGDLINEADEGVVVTLTSTSDARVTVGDGEAAGVILDNDDVTLSIANGEVDEGDATGGLLTLTATLSAASEQTIAVEYSTSDGTATAGEDYTAIVSGPLTFAPGETEASATVSVSADTAYEDDETITVTLAAATGRGVALLTGAAAGTILNDDDAPAISLTDVTAVEGYDDDVTFTITLSGDTEEDVSVGYVTTAGTAVGPTDYVETDGTLTIAAGSTSAPITVTLVDDDDPEDEEEFTLTLTDPVAATLTVASATCLITDDDHPPLTVTPPTSASEGLDTAFSAEIVLPISSLTSATLYYSEGGAAAESEASFTQEPDIGWTATVPGTSVSTRGLLWR